MDPGVISFWGFEFFFDIFGSCRICNCNKEIFCFVRKTLSLALHMALALLFNTCLGAFRLVIIYLCPSFT